MLAHHHYKSSCRSQQNKLASLESALVRNYDPPLTGSVDLLAYLKMSQQLFETFPRNHVCFGRGRLPHKSPALPLLLQDVCIITWEHCQPGIFFIASAFIVNTPQQSRCIRRPKETPSVHLFNISHLKWFQTMLQNLQRDLYGCEVT